MTKPPLHGTGRRSKALSLVLPAFNEEESIATAIDEADTALRQLACTYEIIVVDDGSGDSTARVVEEKARTNEHVRLLSHSTNRGYGAALRTGFEAARSPLIAFTDADCQFYLDDLGLLLARAHDQDVVCGFRVDRQDPWPRRFYSACYNGFVRGLLSVPVRDCDCALKIFRAETLAAIRIETDGFLVNAEILAKLKMQGSRIAEVGVRHRTRYAGETTVSPLDAIPVVLSLLRFWWTWVLFPPLSVDPVDYRTSSPS
ncbi:MAG: glycosyltransferase family 2 protein [Acidobacteria bacterium]|nr:glycosyltransferase family 2 protein [Acidobacteriota bacterium]